jgi:hypothetical protein
MISPSKKKDKSFWLKRTHNLGKGAVGMHHTRRNNGRDILQFLALALDIQQLASNLFRTLHYALESAFWDHVQHRGYI